MLGEHSLSIVSFNGTHLAFPLNETVGLQRSAELAQENENLIPFSVGSVVHANRRWPVFCLNTDYSPMTTLSPGMHHCICLSADNSQTGIALACETIETYRLAADDIAPVTLPTCMQRQATPLRQLFLYDEHILPVSSAPALATYLRSLLEEIEPRSGIENSS